MRTGLTEPTVGKLAPNGAVLIRFKERRTVAEFAPHDWVAAPPSTSLWVVPRLWPTRLGCRPRRLVVILARYAMVSWLRHWSSFRPLIDCPVLVLIGFDSSALGLYAGRVRRCLAEFALTI